MILGLSTELDAVANHSEIVPDTVIFDDFEKLVVCFFYLLCVIFYERYSFDVCIFVCCFSDL